jgi:hypothetical protein
MDGLTHCGIRITNPELLTLVDIYRRLNYEDSVKKNVLMTGSAINTFNLRDIDNFDKYDLIFNPVKKCFELSFGYYLVRIYLDADNSGDVKKIVVKEEQFSLPVVEPKKEERDVVPKKEDSTKFEKVPLDNPKPFGPMGLTDNSKFDEFSNDDILSNDSTETFGRQNSPSDEVRWMPNSAHHFDEDDKIFGKNNDDWFSNYGKDNNVNWLSETTKTAKKYLKWILYECTEKITHIMKDGPNISKSKTYPNPPGSTAPEKKESDSDMIYMNDKYTYRETKKQFYNLENTYPKLYEKMDNEECSKMTLILLAANPLTNVDYQRATKEEKEKENHYGVSYMDRIALALTLCEDFIKFFDPSLYEKTYSGDIIGLKKKISFKDNYKDEWDFSSHRSAPRNLYRRKFKNPKKEKMKDFSKIFSNPQNVYKIAELQDIDLPPWFCQNYADLC